MFAAFVVPKPFSVLLVTLLGVFILLVVAVILVMHLRRLVKHDHPVDVHLVGAVMLSYCLLFSTHAAIGRVSLGIPEAPFSSRYRTLLIPVYLAIYFCALSRSWWNRRNVALGLFVLSLAPAALLERRGTIHWLSDGKRMWVNCYLRTENVHYCDQVAHFVIYPYPEHNDFQWKLNFLKQHRLNLFAHTGPSEATR